MNTAAACLISLAQYNGHAEVQARRFTPTDCTIACRS